ncbi:RNA polymerase sigma factor [Microbacterium sp. NEAU-LLC]|uniref:RNA polymerase sigma factor n=1 Tax=Microbacterium helvum TaxID=2773713 RepID=A0ABR8NM66_9MICO|nr:RNA polymerase sigma factor [Microbacterium helvum]MBD3941764.1 RNA polymerase sigma factor [Microbacterium helvum]
MPAPLDGDIPIAAASESSVSDETLLRHAREGDESAMRTLLRRHEKKMYALALTMTRNAADAEDAVGITQLALWRKRDEVRGVDGSLLPWLLKTVALAAKNQLRGQRRYERLIASVPAAEEVPDHADEVARHVDRTSLSHDIETALRTASAADAQVIALCLLEGMPPRDAAVVIGASESTVRKRLTRAKERLRKTLAHHAPHTVEGES